METITVTEFENKMIEIELLQDQYEELSHMGNWLAAIKYQI